MKVLRIATFKVQLSFKAVPLWHTISQITLTLKSICTKLEGHVSIYIHFQEMLHHSEERAWNLT
jgi:hypothetical protein